MSRASARIAILAAALFASDARADDISAATIGLRSGYDSNPLNVEGGKGSLFVAPAVAWDFLRGSDKDGFGVSVNLGAAFYDPRVTDAAFANALAVRHAIGLAPNLLLRSSLSATNDQTWSRRQNAFLWRERIDYESGGLRLFASADARLAALNERNIFALGGFLPRDESFTTGSVLTGAAWRSSFGEIGASFMAARTRYRHETDYLGFVRDNDRWQPNLFASTSFRGVNLEGSLSYLNVNFPAKDFDGIRRLLYTAKATIPIDRLTFSLSSARAAEDTTLPLSVVNLTTQHEARAAAQLTERDRLDLFARRKTDDYLGLDARATTLTLGAEYQRKLKSGLAAIAGASWRRTIETGANPVNAINVQIGLQAQFDVIPAKGKPDDATAAK